MHEVPAQEKFPEADPLLAEAVGREEKSTGGQAAEDAVVTHSRQAHRGDATALRAIGISSELAWSDLGPKVGRDGPGRSGKDAFFR